MHGKMMDMITCALQKKVHGKALSWQTLNVEMVTIWELPVD